VLGEQRERVRQWMASPGFASCEFGCRGVGHLISPAWKY
jgi:hypothetical protein